MIIPRIIRKKVFISIYVQCDTVGKMEEFGQITTKCVNFKKILFKCYKSFSGVQCNIYTFSLCLCDLVYSLGTLNEM